MKKATLTERYSGVQIACWLLESALMLTSVGFFIAALVAAIQAGATGKPLGSELFRLMICAPLTYSRKRPEPPCGDLNRSGSFSWARLMTEFTMNNEKPAFI